MSESNGLITMGLEFHNKIGSVGPALRGVSVITDPQNDHEICFRGRNVMMGYLNQRDKTKEVFTENGFVHSPYPLRIQLKNHIVIKPKSMSSNALIAL